MMDNFKSKANKDLTEKLDKEAFGEPVRLRKIRLHGKSLLEFEEKSVKSSYQGLFTNEDRMALLPLVNTDDPIFWNLKNTAIKSGWKILFAFMPSPEIQKEYPDIAEAYAVINRPVAEAGIVLYSYIKGEWLPTSQGRPIIHELLTRLGANIEW
jgi:hypothetical protein